MGDRLFEPETLVIQSTADDSIVASATCRNCRYWLAAPDESIGQCRRYAPNGLTQVSVAGINGAEWPSTWPQMWCGEHQP